MRRDTSEKGSWTSRPLAAKAFRVVVLLVPILLGWIAVRFASPLFVRPQGWYGPFFWLAQAVTVAALATAMARRLADRLAPLHVLLTLALVFPDTAPSRFRLALRASSTRKMEQAVQALDADVTTAATQALEMVVRLGHHERRTRGHVERVRAYGELIGAELGVSGDELERLRWGLLLHDVGKLKVPAAILDKPSAPTKDEWTILRRHPAEGAKLVESLRPWLGHWIDAAGHHHEKWSGAGYPNGLAGEEICLAGRICAVADAYDVITSRRSYKVPRSHAEAREELVKGSGDHFDPQVVRAMLAVGIERRRSTTFFGALFEFPGILEISQRIAQLPIAPLAAATAVAVGALASPTMAPMTETAPGNLALVAQDHAVEPTVGTQPPPSELLPTASRTVSTLSGGTPETTGQPSSEPAMTTTTSSPTDATTVPTTATSATTIRATTSQTTMSPTTTQATTTTAPTAPTTETTAATTTTVVTGDSISILTAADMPASLAADQLESPDTIFLFQETGPVTLPSDVTVRAPNHGVEVPVDEWAAETILLAGTTVCSWFLHFDPAPGVETIEATVTLPSTILGYGGWPLDFARTDFLSVSGVNYHYDQSDLGDFITIDGSTFGGSFTALPARTDQLRILTDC